MKLVKRDDFDVVKEMVVEIKKEQQNITKRLKALETKLRRKNKPNS